MRHLLVMVWLIVGVLPAAANFLTYAQWAALPPQLRAFYIAGAFDQLTTIAGTVGDTDMLHLAKHYRTVSIPQK